MLFNSLQYLIFFPIVCLIYFAIPQKIRWIWLLIVSYYFYMCWNPKYALLMFTSTFITWLSGQFIDRFNQIEDKHKSKVAKNITVAISFTSNLAILFFFKYFNFAMDSVNYLLNYIHWRPLNTSFDVILPVGISFYTFQALSYTMDVYRKDVPAEKNLFRYMLFVSFFPQLVAGPIERSKNLIHQLRERHTFDLLNAKRGLLLMLWGFFQKVVIADRISIAVKTVYNNHTSFGGVELILATVLFAVQIYCDFSSYTNIAKGSAQVMGFRLIDNFNQPYFATSIADFWRRWHMSLSTWFKDYLYIPLGGNRHGKARKYLNVMIVFFTSGLWHGASWNFVIWGILHGLFQIVGDFTMPFRKKVCQRLSINQNTHLHRLFQRAITFVLVCFAWIFFVSPTMGIAIDVIKSIFTKWNPWVLTNGGLLAMGLDTKQWLVLLVSVLILLMVSSFHHYDIHLRDPIIKSNILLRWTVVFAMIFVVLIFGIYGPGYDENQFIYFQF